MTYQEASEATCGRLIICDETIAASDEGYIVELYADEALIEWDCGARELRPISALALA